MPTSDLDTPAGTALSPREALLDARKDGTQAKDAESKMPRTHDKEPQKQQSQAFHPECLFPPTWQHKPPLPGPLTAHLFSLYKITHLTLRTILRTNFWDQGVWGGAGGHFHSGHVCLKLRYITD